jgi:hypothetical protein
MAESVGDGLEAVEVQIEQLAGVWAWRPCWDRGSRMRSVSGTRLAPNGEWIVQGLIAQLGLRLPV